MFMGIGAFFIADQKKHRMNFRKISTLLLIFFCLTHPLPAESLNPVPFYKVQMKDVFWQPRMKIQQTVLLPHAFNKTRPAIDNMRKTGNFLQDIKDELPFPHRYITSDLFKVMEGAAYLLKNQRDAALERKMDSIIDIIAAAQTGDGYMYDAHITGVSKKHEHWGGAGMGDKSYSWVLHSHELYNMGHMYEAAVAYFNSTGKRKWLNVAEKNAQHINKVFFIGDKNYNNGKPVMQAPGHEEIELALVKLYHATGKKLYLQMAKKFLDIRGVTYKPEGEGVMSPEYSQQHLPVKQQTKPTGHAVRAAYLYAGLADVSAATNDKSYIKSLESIWQNITDTRMHITGGLGAVHGIEGFGKEYELPNKNAYNETCAAVGNVFFNYRMFLMTKEGKYADVAEVALLNNALAGANIEGNKFFYVNPLEADGITKFNHGLAGRSEWFSTACCPSNLARLIPQVSGMMYANTANEIYCVMYGGNSAEVALQNGIVKLVQQTNYPFEETINIAVTPAKKNQKFDLKLRIPTWAGNERFMPGSLYRYINHENSVATVKLNGKKIKAPLKDGFVAISRKWKKGDSLQLQLPMPVHYTIADERVKEDIRKIAITRGPLVFCAEETDNGPGLETKQIEELRLSENIFVKNMQLNFLKKVPVIELPVIDGATRTSLKMIPYHLWNNRGDGKMLVWINSGN